MNIFYLSSDPGECARQHCDKHVVKMIVEYAQLMSTAHRLLDGVATKGKTANTGRSVVRWVLPDDREDHVYLAGHVNHPSAVWTRESAENYKWLYSLWLELMDEYTFRYGKQHACTKLIGHLANVPNNIRHTGLTVVPQCMPDEYKVAGDTIAAYKNFYCGSKSRFAKWTKRDAPNWYKENL